MSRKNLSSQSATKANDRLGVTRNPITQRSPIGFGASQGLGSYGGYDIVASAKVDVEDLINNKLKIEIDKTTGKIDIGVQGGSEKVVGGGVGIKASIDSKGQVNIEQVSAEIGAAGFGVGASIGANSSAASASAFGVKIEIGRDESGVSAKICYSVGVGEICTEIKPRQPSDSPTPTPTPTPEPTIYPPRIPQPPVTSFPVGACVYYDRHFYGLFFVNSQLRGDSFSYPTPIPSAANNFVGNLKVTNTQSWSPAISPQPTVRYYRGSNTNSDAYQVFGDPSTLEANPVVNQKMITYFEGQYAVSRFSTAYSVFTQYIYIRIGLGAWTWQSTWTNEIREFNCPGVLTPKLFPLPNPPQKYMTCNCCNEIKEIHKYLGIEKLKKHKFKVAKQFLAPGGKGNENAEDYYAITQALFKMLANGLILNPISKPLGSKWQDANATAWAANIYEMVAEAMSNGDSTQKFEISAIMQLVQIMSAIAENTRKTEFVADAIGFTPTLTEEELPVCFSIYEKHKGFGQKRGKKISVGAKNDTEVESTLSFMLQPSLVPIARWEFTGEINLVELLQNGKT